MLLIRLKLNFNKIIKHTKLTRRWILPTYYRRTAKILSLSSLALELRCSFFSLEYLVSWGFSHRWLVSLRRGCRIRERAFKAVKSAASQLPELKEWRVTEQAERLHSPCIFPEKESYLGQVYTRPVARQRKRTMDCVSLSPRQGVSSGCGWRNGLQYGG
jgi:hypothetical protein